MAILYCYHAMLVAMPDTLLPISVQKSRSRQEKKLKVVRQEHDFPPEILFVVVQHIPKRRGNNKRALIHPKDTVLTHKTYQQQTSYYFQSTAYYQLHIARIASFSFGAISSKAADMNR